MPAAHLKPDLVLHRLQRLATELQHNAPLLISHQAHRRTMQKLRLHKPEKAGSTNSALHYVLAVYEFAATPFESAAFTQRTLRPSPPPQPSLKPLAYLAPHLILTPQLSRFQALDACLERAVSLGIKPVCDCLDGYLCLIYSFPAGRDRNEAHPRPRADAPQHRTAHALYT